MFLFGGLILLAPLCYVRNVLLGVVGLVFSGAALLINLYDIINMYYRLGWHPDAAAPTQLLALLDLLLPAIVLIVGGALAALSGRSSR